MAPYLKYSLAIVLSFPVMCICIVVDFYPVVNTFRCELSDILRGKRCSDSVSARQRIPEYPHLRRAEGEYRKQYRDHAKEKQRPFCPSASHRPAVEQSRLVYIRGRCRQEENPDVEPVGGRADHAVVRVKEYGNQDKSEKDPPQLNAPKISPLTEEYALHQSVEKHWPEEQLHVLPRGFIYSGKGGDPGGAAQPIV